MAINFGRISQFIMVGGQALALAEQCDQLADLFDDGRITPERKSAVLAAVVTFHGMLSPFTDKLPPLEKLLKEASDVYDLMVGQQQLAGTGEANAKMSEEKRQAFFDRLPEAQIGQLLRR